MAGMTDLVDAGRLAFARQFLSDIGSSDFSQTLKLLSPDVTDRVLGDHALAEVRTGRDAVARHLISIVDQTSGRFDAVQCEDWFVGLHHLGTLVHIEADGATFFGPHLRLARFDTDDRIDLVPVFSEDA